MLLHPLLSLLLFLCRLDARIVSNKKSIKIREKAYVKLPEKSSGTLKNLEADG